MVPSITSFYFANNLEIQLPKITISPICPDFFFLQFPHNIAFIDP